MGQKKWWKITSLGTDEDIIQSKNRNRKEEMSLKKQKMMRQ